MSTTDLAKKIRKELKELNYNSRQVSVTSTYSAIRMTAKNDDVDLDKLEDIASKYRDIDRCEVTGEILAGGNTYIFVKRA